MGARILHGWLRTLWVLGLAVCLGSCVGMIEVESDDPVDETEEIPEELRCADTSERRPFQDPAWELRPGEAVTGYLCPAGDIDHFWFTVPTAGTNLQVNLSNNVTMSPVDLCYKIFPGEGLGSVGGLCDSDGLDGVTNVNGSHYLPDAGTFYLEIRDESGDDEDDRNQYRLVLLDETDPDTNEPNDNMGTATSARDASGYISYLGDMDWYQVVADQPGQIVTIQLSTAGASQVDLAYTLFQPDGATPINSGRNWDGTKGATSLFDALPLAQTGTYFLVIRDQDDDDMDTGVGYHLQVDVKLDPDARDQSPRNDAFDKAVSLGDGGTVSGGYLATRGDEDWFRIEVPGVGGNNPGLLEIELQISNSSPVDPAVDLLRADPDTPCSAGDDCDTLSATCGTGSCDSVECRNAQCPSFECITHLNKCSGAGVCLPEGGGRCGIRSLTMHGADWSQTGSVRHLHTVAPMFDSVYYVTVRDFHADALDLDNAYRLVVTFHQEPDSHEHPANGLYIPYATNDQEDETRTWNRNMAGSLNCSDSGGEITCTIEGYLSYRGDQDWYKLESIPTGQNYDLQFPWSFQGNNDMVINYTMFLGSKAHTGFVEGAGSGTWGTSGCVYLCGDMHTRRPAYLRVMHRDRKEYDYQNPYQITIKAYPRCPSSCQHCVGDGYCPH